MTAVWDEAELAEIEEMRTRHRPIPVPLRGGQCVRDAFAVCLRRQPRELPLRWTGEEAIAWADKVGEMFGVRCDLVLPGELPPPNNETWVAIVPGHTDPEVTHALPMIGRTPMTDRDLYPHPMDGLLGGVLIRPADTAA